MTRYVLKTENTKHNGMKNDKKQEKGSD